MKRALLLFAAACASTPHPTSPPPAVIPSAVVEVMCGRMRSEGMSSDLRIVRTTQPLVTPAVIAALADVAFYRGKPVATVMPNASVPVEPASCSRVMIDALNPKRDADTMVLQFSSPFSNPYTRHQIGVIARLSLGDDSPAWYWIPIADRNGSWGPGSPLMLAVHD
ncbi:MAG: hypothetical protein M3041_07450 [Acidobacteriota bacterium]|nr:hypothetical protein [Acidobacteriota bacterium]